MKIIHRGTAPEVPFNLSCSTCSTIVELTRSEMIVDHFGCAHVKCPVCDKNIVDNFQSRSDARYAMSNKNQHEPCRAPKVDQASLDHNSGYGPNHGSAERSKEPDYSTLTPEQDARTFVGPLASPELDFEFYGTIPATEILIS